MGVLTKWSRFVARRWRTVLLFWLIGVVALGALSGVGVKSLNGVTVTAPGSESAQVIAKLRPLSQSGTYVVGLVQASPKNAKAVAEARKLTSALRASPGVAKVFSYADTPVKDLAAADGSSFAVVTIMDGAQSDADLERNAVNVQGRVGHLNGGDTIVTGDAVTIPAMNEYAKADAETAEIIATPIALVVLVVVLSGLAVAFLPLVGAATAIVATLASFVIWGQFTDLSPFAQNITTLFGIGLGIDYGLLILARYREELAAGRGQADALTMTVAAAGRTVAVSSGTVAISLLGLLFFGDPMLTSFAIAGVTVTLLVAAASVFILPAFIMLLGRRIKPKALTASGFFARVTKRVQRRPGAVMVVVAVGLASLALPFLSIKAGVSDASMLPVSSPVRRGAEQLSGHYPGLAAEPIVVVADVLAGSPKAVAYMKAVAKTPGVKSVAPALNVTGAKTPTVIDVIAEGPAAGNEAVSVVHRLRADRPSFGVRVGGVAAQTVDARARLVRSLPFGLFWLMGATFVLLFLLTGSVLIPVKAIVMNVLALGASFGALVWVFQEGHGSGLLGFTAPGYIEILTPVEVAMFAFGLSMDYEVFLLSRIKESYDRHGDNDLAVVEGAQHSGGIITTAALLIVIVFGAALAGSLVSLKMFAFAIGLAVIIDATIIRTLLVPATMTVMGDWNWWAPPFMRRFHDRFGISERPNNMVTVDMLLPPAEPPYPDPVSAHVE